MTRHLRPATPEECKHLGPAVIHDPVGGYPDRCIECGTFLGPEPDRWGIWPLVLALVVAVALVGTAMALVTHGTNWGRLGRTSVGVPVTPTPYGFPEGNRTRPPGSLPAPAPWSAPMIGSTHVS
jgi:hypothetical protein